MANNYDIEQCTWCNGQGIDQTYNGKPNPPKCVRCQGSGKIYVTSEMATTKKRRKYMGPVPKEIELSVAPEGSVMVIAESLDGPIIQSPKKKRGRPPKVASGSNPT